MQASDPLDPRAVLGAVKARPGNPGARRKPGATAGLDRPCARRDRRSAGRDEGTALALQLPTCFEVRPLCGGLVSSAPE